MLPEPSPTRRSLADVLPSALAALRGDANPLRLRGARHAVVVLVDGLGAAPLRASAGHARTLAAAMVGKWTAASPFPTTTASALATLTTGVSAGTHGLVGYSVLDPQGDRVVNQLNDWGGAVDPATWQRRPTLFETADVSSFVVGAPRYADSGFTRAVLRGAEYRAARSVADRVDATLSILASERSSLTYLYVPELDMLAHRHGWGSGEWAEALEDLDAELRRLVDRAPTDCGVLVTADHGMVDLGDGDRVLVDEAGGLWDGVRHTAGEPRALQLHLEPSLSGPERAALLERWRSAEDGRGWVASREEAVAAGWFGAVDPEVAPRIGDIIVAARARVGYYDARDPYGVGMIGNHGSWSPDEVDIPVLRLGAFA
jgi:hypothetical protein